MGRVEDAEGHLVVAGKDRVDLGAPLEKAVQTLFAAGDRPVALDDQTFRSLQPALVERLAPASEALLRLPPSQRASDDPDLPGAPGQKMFGGETPDRRVVDADRRQVGPTGHPADEHDRDGQPQASGPRPGAIVADVGDGPYDAVDLTSAKRVQHAIGITALGLEDQVQHYPVADLGRRALDGRHNARWAEE